MDPKNPTPKPAPESDQPNFILLEEAKRRLAGRVGISRTTLHQAGFAQALRERGRYLVMARQPDGSVQLRCFRVPATAVEEVARLIEGAPPP